MELGGGEGDRGMGEGSHKEMEGGGGRFETTNFMSVVSVPRTHP